jgi:hypothetical protein
MEQPDDAHSMYELLIQDHTRGSQNPRCGRFSPQSRALVCHHMTPVAGRGADGEEDRHVALARLGERLLPHSRRSTGFSAC